ncbi:MAG: hypothetical protein Q7S27_05665 [Nanoarchaeota archaeon]|nr:hypothetical protein [Nanoarchaeota archaeon]
MEITTIKLQRDTKKRLDKLKIHKRESYDEAIQHILEILSLCRMNPEKAKLKLAEIDKMHSKFNKQKEKTFQSNKSS